MENIEKTYYISMLYDFYSELLTEKQRQYFELYYFNNYSLQEISTELNVSRNAVSDQNKNTVKILEEYEEKLKLYEKYQTRQKLLKNILELTNDEKIINIINKLKGVD